MPTNANAYNSRVTDESLEKRFRDTFRSQGGAELIDDLYASGVIVPVVDFTQAAEGSQLPTYLQNAWDFSTGLVQNANADTQIVATPGFWKVDLTFSTADNTSAGTNPLIMSKIYIDDGATEKNIWAISTAPNVTQEQNGLSVETEMIVFLRSGDELRVYNHIVSTTNVWYRQVADVSGNLTNPTGFTSS